MVEETRRELDRVILKRLDKNDEAHEKLFEKLDEIERFMSKMDKVIFRIDKDVYGNGAKGIKKRVEVLWDFMIENKKDIKEINKLKITIIKWGGGLAVVVFILELILVNLFKYVFKW